MKIVDGNKDNFKKEVLNKKGIVLVDFNADWCGPCRMLRPILDEIVEENKDARIVSINIDNEEELAEEYSIFSIPCLVVFKDGKEVNRSVGLISKDQVLELLGGE